MSNLERVRSDIIDMAKSVGVPYSVTTIDRVLGAFGDQFVDNVIDLKTTNKSPQKRGFYYRYIQDTDPSNPALDIALKSGLLKLQGHPVDKLVPEIYEKLPLMGDGVDFEANYGMAKIWQFTTRPLSRQEVFSIASLPQSLRDHEAFFEKYKLDQISLFATDYEHRSMNVYFRTNHPEHHTPEFYREMLNELEFPVPSDEVLEILHNVACIAFTFDWDSPHIHRLCPYVPGFTRATLPTHIDPVLATFVDEGKTLLEEPTYIVSWSFGVEGGTYLKVEIEYNGNLMPFFMKVLMS